MWGVHRSPEELPKSNYATLIRIDTSINTLRHETGIEW